MTALVMSSRNAGPLDKRMQCLIVHHSASTLWCMDVSEHISSEKYHITLLGWIFTWLTTDIERVCAEGPGEHWNSHERCIACWSGHAYVNKCLQRHKMRTCMRKHWPTSRSLFMQIRDDDFHHFHRSFS